MISSNIAEELQWQHEQANHFCFNLLSKFIMWSSFEDIEYNNFVPGIIVKCNNTSFNYMRMIEKILKNYTIDIYFDIKEYQYSIQINLKKEYVNQIQELETLFKIQGII